MKQRIIKRLSFDDNEEEVNGFLESLSVDEIADLHMQLFGEL